VPRRRSRARDSSLGHAIIGSFFAPSRGEQPPARGWFMNRDGVHRDRGRPMDSFASTDPPPHGPSHAL
jgi:hypothetical protein